MEIDRGERCTHALSPFPNQWTTNKNNIFQKRSMNKIPAPPPYIDVIDVPVHAPLLRWRAPGSPIKSSTSDASEPEARSEAASSLASGERAHARRGFPEKSPASIHLDTHAQFRSNGNEVANSQGSRKEHQGCPPEASLATRCTLVDD